jgi:cobaltochelatase CobS
MTQKNYRVGSTFDVDVDEDVTTKGYVENHALVPKTETYSFRKGLLSDVLAWWSGYDGQSTKEALFFWGPTGSGKTSLWRQVAARLKIPTHAITGHMTLEFEDLIGSKTLLDGDVLWQDGVLTAAMRHGHVFLLNEVDAVRPEVLIGLNDIMDGQPLEIKENGGEIVKPAPGFRVVFTGNTAGNGDMTGGYQGTMRLNHAFRDRCIFVYVPYMEADDEKATMEKVCDHIPEEVRDMHFEKMITVANTVRERYEGKTAQEPLDVTFSTRTLLRWARMTWYYRNLPSEMGHPAHYALTRALGNSTDEVTHKALLEAAQRVIG